MGAKISGLHLTRNQLATYAYRKARQAGLSTNAADSVKVKTLERVLLGGESIDRVVEDEIQKHANP